MKAAETRVYLSRPYPYPCQAIISLPCWPPKWRKRACLLSHLPTYPPGLALALQVLAPPPPPHCRGQRPSPVASWPSSGGGGGLQGLRGGHRQAPPPGPARTAAPCSSQSTGPPSGISYRPEGCSTWTTIGSISTHRLPQPSRATGRREPLVHGHGPLPPHPTDTCHARLPHYLGL